MCRECLYLINPGNLQLSQSICSSWLRCGNFCLHFRTEAGWTLKHWQQDLAWNKVLEGPHLAGRWWTTSCCCNQLSFSTGSPGNLEEASEGYLILTCMGGNGILWTWLKCQHLPLQHDIWLYMLSERGMRDPWLGMRLRDVGGAFYGAGQTLSKTPSPWLKFGQAKCWEKSRRGGWWRSEHEAFLEPDFAV